MSWMRDLSLIAVGATLAMFIIGVLMTGSRADEEERKEVEDIREKAGDDA